ncbi:IS4 family transposase, partial [candidate division KSB1 bacterium]|nr:IS4 family transposase [candidate division KSB1 bacterium]
STYVLIAIVKKKLKIDAPLYTFLQILSLTVFEKTPILQLVSDSDYKLPHTQIANQLELFS